MRSSLVFAFATLLASSAACANGSNASSPGCVDTGGTSSAIIGGTVASMYPEAILVDMYQNGQMAAACSGSLIAPQVVLTAGHCVDGFDEWHIKAPFAKNQTAVSYDAETYDWNEGDAEVVNPDHHDVALIYLPSPIVISSYPQIAQVPVSTEPVVNIGRIQDGTFSQTALFVGDPIYLYDGTYQGFPYDYTSSVVIQSGDSGGPDEIAGANPHMIVSVNSGAGDDSQVWARVDLLYDWIEQNVQLHGGDTPPPSTTTIDAGPGTKQDAGKASPDPSSHPPSYTGDSDGDDDGTQGDGDGDDSTDLGQDAGAALGSGTSPCAH